MNMMHIRVYGLFLLTVFLLSLHSHAQNIYPDPDFERNGIVGEARSGQKAGYLSVRERQHWVCLGDALYVEPFATYRARAWVKAKGGSGSRYALFCYEWNSFDWAYTRNVLLHDIADWVQVEVVFMSPVNRIMFHPLAFIGAANAQAWVDDVTVEKIKSPEETIRPLLEKPNPSMEELQILARFFIARGEKQKAKSLMEKADDYTKADIACLLAKHTPDPHPRREFVVDMVRFGGLRYSNGKTRFEELTADLTPRQRLSVLERVFALNVGSREAAIAYREIATRYLNTTSGAYTCADVEGIVEDAATSVQRVLASLPQGATGREEVESVRKAVDEAREAARQRRASLGKCAIRISGKKVCADSYAIVIPDAPTPQEQHAARDLQCHLELVSSELLPIMRDSEVGERTPIVVGRSAWIKKLGVRANLDALGTDGILIKTVGPALVLTGNRRGVLYACYTFLEDYLKVHWLSPDCTIFPKKGTFDIGNLNFRYIPPLKYREPFAFCGYDADWAVRNKSNGSATRLDAQRGGKVVYKGFVHTFYPLVPPEKYFAQHPEYYSEIDGERRCEHAQLCLTNPEVEDRVIEAVRQWLKETPDANIVSVSQNDWGGYCQCAKCKAVDEEEGSPSGSLLRFVNRVAERLEKEFPDVAIDTLAYQYTRKPPKLTRPHPNVIVRLCSIECSFSQPLGTGKQNVSFRKDIEGWGKICKRLYVWDYVTNFAHYLQPHPNLHVLQPNIQFFVRNGVKGIFEQGGYQSPGGEMQELRTWLLAKLLWNPKADVNALMQTFLEGYYGPAAPYVRRYISLMHEAVKKTDTYLSCYTPTDAPFLNPKIIAEADALFDKAEHAVRMDATFLKRVQTARLPLLYVHIMCDRTLFREEKDTLIATGADKSIWIRKFEAIARAAGVTHVREGGNANLEEWLSQVGKQTAVLRMERLKNNMLDVAILPELGGRIWRICYLPSGKDIILRMGNEGGFQPSEGGYEEYSGIDYRSPGWNESYSVVERGANFVSLQTNLRNGLQLYRRIELDPQSAKIRIISTLSNPGATPRAACLRVHPSFAVSETQNATVWILSRNGNWQKHSLANPSAPLAERELWFRGDKCPEGEWAVVDGSDRLAIINRFDREQIGLCYLNWSGKQSRVNLELWSPSMTLQPQESVTIDHTYEVTTSFSPH